jgi:hypothetical protein
VKHDLFRRLLSVLASMASTATSPGLPFTTADALQKREYDWNPRHIRWIDVLRYQHYGGLLILIPAAIITGMLAPAAVPLASAHPNSSCWLGCLKQQCKACASSVGHVHTLQVSLTGHFRSTLLSGKPSCTMQPSGGIAFIIGSAPGVWCAS